MDWNLFLYGMFPLVLFSAVIGHYLWKLKQYDAE